MVTNQSEGSHNYREEDKCRNNIIIHYLYIIIIYRNLFWKSLLANLLGTNKYQGEYQSSEVADWEPLLSMAGHGLRADLRVRFLWFVSRPHVVLAQIQEGYHQFTRTEEF